MDEELKKQKYRNLLNQMRIINSKLNSLNNDYIKVNNDLKNNIVIDKQTIGMENLDKINKNVNSIINEINKTIIPIINKNI